MAVIETLNLISKTMDDLIDFAVNDEYLSKEFEKFIEINELYTEKSSELAALVSDYILDEKTADNTSVLDYCAKNCTNRSQKIISALRKSYISVFKVNKILKNVYQCTSLASENNFELIPLTKMSNLRGIGLYDYIKARIIEIDNIFYILEIFDCYGAFREHMANTECIRCLIKYPESQTMYNKEKLKELEASTKLFYGKFTEIFGTDEIVMTNVLADEFIFEFNNLVSNKPNTAINKERYVNVNVEYKFFKQHDSEEDFIKNAVGGFSASEQTYDIGFFMDKDSGLYIVPFLGTVNEILRTNSIQNITGAKECLEYFLSSEKVSPNLIIKKTKEYKNFLDLINEALGTNFKDIREILGRHKAEWSTSQRFSPTMALYNSKTFEKMIGFEEEMENKAAHTGNIGRNEPCPCGSGKKYKNCCMA